MNIRLGALTLNQGVEPFLCTCTCDITEGLISRRACCKARFSEKWGKQKEMRVGILSLPGITDTWPGSRPLTYEIYWSGLKTVSVPQRDLVLLECTDKVDLASSGTFTLITMLSLIHYYPDYRISFAVFCAHGWILTTGRRIIVNSKARRRLLLFPHLWPCRFSNKYWEKPCDNEGQ